MYFYITLFFSLFLVSTDDSGYKSQILPGKPVVTPKKDDEKKKEDGPPVAKKTEDTVVSGQGMPLLFVRNKLSAMKVAETGYITIAAVKVDPKRNVWLDPDEIFSTKSKDRVVCVKRDENGYKLILDENLGHQWIGADLPDSKTWIPVKSIEIGK